MVVPQNACFDTPCATFEENPRRKRTPFDEQLRVMGLRFGVLNLFDAGASRGHVRYGLEVDCAFSAPVQWPANVLEARLLVDWRAPHLKRVGCAPSSLGFRV